MSVTNNLATVVLSSNTVYQDNWTKLFWSDRSATTLDNEFIYIDGSDRANPAGNSCNFTATGQANAYCDNQDPLSAYTEDNDVSAAEFCLNLSLDSDNADSENNGVTGAETDWRLPTQKELLQAYIHGSANHLPNASSYHWSSTELFNSQSSAWYSQLGHGYTISATKDSSGTIYVRCVRHN